MPTMTMLAGAYSSRYKAAESDHVRHLRVMYGGDNVDIIARNRQLQQETNRRRKALALKRKEEVEREERRREEILIRRREEIREATEKYMYQRIRRPISMTVNTAGRSEVLNRRVSSATQRRPVNTCVTDGMHSAGTDVTQLQNRSIRQANSSRSLFEQRLQQHQEWLISQQAQALAGFDAAVQSQLSNAHAVIRGHCDQPDASHNAHADAPNKIDVADAQNVRESVGEIAMHGVTGDRTLMTRDIPMTASETFSLQRKSVGKSPVAVVSPCVHSSTDNSNTAAVQSWLNTAVQSNTSQKEKKEEEISATTAPSDHHVNSYKVLNHMPSIASDDPLQQLFHKLRSGPPAAYEMSVSSGDAAVVTSQPQTSAEPVQMTNTSTPSSTAVTTANSNIAVPLHETVAKTAKTTVTGSYAQLNNVYTAQVHQDTVNAGLKNTTSVTPTDHHSEPTIANKPNKQQKIVPAPPAKKAPAKGILKKNNLPVGSVRGHNFKHTTLSAKRSDMRDSIDLAREHLAESQQVTQTKSVRFAENVYYNIENSRNAYLQAAPEYEEDSSSESGEEIVEEKLFKKPKVDAKKALPNSKKGVPLTSRPSSASVLPNSAPISAPRSVSAGVAHLTGKGIPFSQSAPLNKTTPNTASNGDVPTTCVDLDLNRTPTDEDINLVWQSVRTCLSKNGVHPPTTTTRQMAPPVVVPYGASTNEESTHRNTTENNSTRKFSMDALSSYNRRRQVLLQQRSSTHEGTGVDTFTTNSSARPVTSAAPTTTIANYRVSSSRPMISTGPALVSSNTRTMISNGPALVSSNTRPTAANHTGPALVNSTAYANDDLSDSMTMFLQAEALSKKSLSDSALQSIMADSQMNSHIKTMHKAPTTLSIEEQRLLQSLEILNQRLKANQMNLKPAGLFVPRPPAAPCNVTPHKNVRNRPPLNSGYQRRFGSNNGTTSQHHFRVNSIGPFKNDFGHQAFR